MNRNKKLDNIIYYIPMIGWLIAVYQYHKTFRAYKNGGSSKPTWEAYNNTFKAFFSTIIFLLGGIVILKIFFE